MAADECFPRLMIRLVNPYSFSETIAKNDEKVLQLHAALNACEIKNQDSAGASWKGRTENKLAAFRKFDHH